MSNPLLTKNFTAGAAVTKYRIVKFGTSDTKVIHAAAAANALIGVVADLGAASGERVDAHVAGVAFVEYGGTVARGDPLTSDANGKAVAAVFDGSSKVNTIGRAMASGVSGDVGLVAIAPSRIGAEKAFVPFFINQTDLLAGTSQFVVSPVAGNVTKVTTAVQVAVTTGGNITAKIGGTAIDGLAVVVADAAAVGDIDSDAPSSPTHATTVIAKDGAIEIVVDAAFATAGALNGFVEVTL